MARKRPKHPTATLLRLGALRVDLLNGRADWREYLVWQLGLLAASLSLLGMLLLVWRPDMVSDLTALYVLLALLPGTALGSVLLWWLIKREYSGSKRFALAFLVLAGITAGLSALGTFGGAGGIWFDLLLVGTTLYLLGTGVIGLIIFVRGDDVSPWWKR